MSRFHLPFSVVMLSNFTSIRGRDMHNDGRWLSKSLAWFHLAYASGDEPSLDTKSQPFVFCLILRVRNSDIFHSIGKQVS